MSTSVEIREELVSALKLDLVGPDPEGGQHQSEVLDRPPSRFYLNGFLVPFEAEGRSRRDETAEEGLALVTGDRPSDDAGTPEGGSARKAFFPSSLGLSVLLPPAAQRLDVFCTWGDYRQMEAARDRGTADPDRPPLESTNAQSDSPVDPTGEIRRQSPWERTPQSQMVTISLPAETDRPVEYPVPGSNGLVLSLSVRPIAARESGDGGRLPVPAGTRSISVFLVNHRRPAPDERKDEGFAFQAAIAIKSTVPFVSRPSVRDPEGHDFDECIANLQYRDAGEYAVGHGVSSHAVVRDGQCHLVESTYIPRAEVEKVVARSLPPAIELGMEAIANMQSAAEIGNRLGGITAQYQTWITEQRNTHIADSRFRATCDQLLDRAEIVRRRIEDGFSVLSDPRALLAFQIANRAMATAALRRSPNDYRNGRVPTWRPFQIAFLLMNLRGVFDPAHLDRDIVDLLFFPTGGGKTEAYLGLAAFTLVLRRLRNPGLGSAGVSVLMRYTLRLLTLDQLGRAATLICALELLRQKDPETLGPWPFEIGLWVGQAATPNRMGQKGDNDKHTARARTIAYKGDDTRNPSPIPLENCPWCGWKFTRNSFSLQPNEDRPLNLKIVCANRDCAFYGRNPLPIVAVDEPIYRRLPSFLIATVDKFASLPWVGQSGALFGHVERHDKEGFYGAADPAHGTRLESPLPPPDLIIQDELHLISGPLGTMVGLYETAIDALATRAATDSDHSSPGDKPIRPKVVASTATVRKAEEQIRALFGRQMVEIFPPPGPDRRDSFFAQTVARSQKNARLYLGIAAQGRSLKVVLLRTYLALLSAAQKAYEASGGKANDQNPADPYMTLLGYFNSLRELGGSRRIVEDEVSSRLQGYASRLRVGEATGQFANRTINSTDIVELTSREPTNKVSDAKRRLAIRFRPDKKDRVDVAIATNMISVGLDITRLGLMVVLGQPKMTAEYIQATSRVGRDDARPGLVVTLLNVHRPRDRSHYERFEAYHETFYRGVEATSVTPFSPRAIDRGIAAVTVTLARHQNNKLTRALGAADIIGERGRLGFVGDTLGHRAEMQPGTTEERQALRDQVRTRAADLLDEWARIAAANQSTGTGLQYQREAPGAPPLLFDPLDPETETNAAARKFRARRSLRDVEPSVNLWLKSLDGADVEIEVDGGSDMGGEA